MKHTYILVHLVRFGAFFLYIVLYCGPKVDPKKSEDVNLIALLQKRENGIVFKSLHKDVFKRAIIQRTKAATEFHNILRRKISKSIRWQKIAAFMKRNPECINDLFFVLDGRQDAFECKQKIFLALSTEQATLKNQDLLRNIIRSDNFDINAPLESVLLDLDNDSLCEIKKTLLHSAVENRDIPLMQLLSEFNVDVTVKASSGLTPLESYELYVERMKTDGFFIDPIEYQEIISILTPKQD